MTITNTSTASTTTTTNTACMLSTVLPDVFEPTQRATSGAPVHRLIARKAVAAAIAARLTRAPDACRS